MEKIIYIYTLTDPNNNQVRYVGKTINPNRRYNEHINNCHRSNNNHKDNWIKILISNNQLPIINIIEESTVDNWSDREKYWISSYDNLTNSTIGGEDGTVSDEVRNRMVIMNTGDNNPMWGKKWTKSQREKLSKQRKGVKKSEEWKTKVSKKMGKKCTIDGVEYDSIRKAAIILNKNFKSILKIINK